MKINEELLPYEKHFYSECNKIKFFCLSLNEIKFQLEFLEKICKKELEIYEKQSSQILSLINNFQNNFLLNYESEPSNLVKIILDLITVIRINFQLLRVGLIECYKIFENNIPNISKTLDKLNQEILKKSCLKLKENNNNLGNKEKLNDYIKQTFELVANNIFKGLVYIHQFFFLYSKAKNDFNMSVKNNTEEKSNNKIINIVINDFSERKFAKEIGIYYEPIHFGNYNYDILLKNESENIVSLSDSYLYYGQIFIKCIQIRKKVIAEFKKLINEILVLSPNNIIEKIAHVKEKILKTKNNFKIIGIGTEKSWDLLIQNWGVLYNCMNSFMIFCKEICKENLNENLNEKNEEYKTFENEWSKLSKKIIDLKNKHIKYYTNDKKKQIKDNQKEYKIMLEKEKQIKTFLNSQCYDFLNTHVPILRENEKKIAILIQEVCYRFKKLLKKNNEEEIENTKIELENEASIDIYQELKYIFNKYNNNFQIRDFDKYMDDLKDKILTNYDFGEDDLTKQVKLSLDNYFQNNLEINGYYEPSLSESVTESLKESKIEGDENVNNNSKENSNNIININNNNTTNNNDLTIPSLFTSQKSNNILKNKLSSKEIILKDNKNYNNLNNTNNKDLLSINEQLERKNTKNKNNTNLNNINENNSFNSVNEDEEENKEINDSNDNDIKDIINNYYNNPLIKNRLLNRSKNIYEMLTEIHFFERLENATKDRMEKFEKEFKTGMNFRKTEEFDNTFIKEKDIKSTSPLTLIFHYIFNPKTVINEYPHFKSFFECIFLSRGDYNLNVIYDKYEIDKIPKYFNDLNYVNNLFNNYNKNDLDLFLRQIDTWYKSFSFQLHFIHPLKKLMIGPDKITIKDVAIIYFISPTDLIVDYHSYGSDFPFAEKFVSSSQYRFHCDIKFNKNIGRFTFKTSAIVYNKITIVSETYFEEILKKEADKNNSIELQNHTWGPFCFVIETESKKNEIEADKIFSKHLKNTIFNYSDEKLENFEIEENNSSGNDDNFSSSDSNNSSSNGEEKEVINYNKKKKKRKKNKNKNIMNNDNLYYGILAILGLFSLKTLFGINNGFFTFDTFMNLLILFSIGFVLYKSRN